MANALCSFTTFLWLGLLSRSGLGFTAISSRLPVSYGCSNVKLRTLPSLNVLNDNQTPDLNPVEAPATRGGFLSILDRNNAILPPPIPENSRPYEAARNSVAISVFVALTAWTVLTVDIGIARGWTLGEVLLYMPRDNWRSYLNALRDVPVLTKTEINVFIYLVGDYAAQVEWGKRHWLDFDLVRTLRNGAIGAMFGPLVSVYYDFSDAILPPDVLSNAPKKIFMDQTVYLATKTSIYLTLLGVLSGKPLNDTAADVQGKLWPILSRAWRFWPFVHLITYSVIPPAQRVLWVNCVDLVWSSILAGMASGTPSPTEVAEPEECHEMCSQDETSTGVVLCEDKSSISSSNYLKPEN